MYASVWNVNHTHTPDGHFSACYSQAHLHAGQRYRQACYVPDISSILMK